MIDYESGMRGIVDVRWHSRTPRDEFRIIGVDGEMDLTPLSGPKLSYPGAAEDLSAHTNLHYPCVENFVAAVLDERIFMRVVSRRSGRIGLTERALGE